MEEKLITALVAFLLAGAAWLKSHSEVEGVKKDRETTKMERDTDIALPKAKYDELERRQNAADSRLLGWACTVG